MVHEDAVPKSAELGGRACLYGLPITTSTNAATCIRTHDITSLNLLFDKANGVFGKRLKYKNRHLVEAST